MNKDKHLIYRGHTCPWWFIISFDNPFRKLFHDPQKLLAPYVDQGNTVLDVGCGMGYFTIGLAKLVGVEGKVIAADVQQEMLAGVRRRAKRAGLDDRIELHSSTANHIGLKESVDFVLAFWMVHEVKQPEQFMGQIYSCLKDGGCFLIVEPKIHVSSNGFERSLTQALASGFRVADRPKVSLSRATLLKNKTS